MRRFPLIAAIISAALPGFLLLYSAHVVVAARQRDEQTHLRAISDQRAEIDRLRQELNLCRLAHRDAIGAITKTAIKGAR